jgi:hypothetical protein
MPRNVEAKVSRFQRTRIHGARFTRGDVFTLSADFNGAFAAGVTLSSIVWRVTNPQAVILGAAAISGRSATVHATAGIGCSAAKCIATGSDGAVFTQLFHITAQDAPYFDGETVPAAGATSATA